MMVMPMMVLLPPLALERRHPPPAPLANAAASWLRTAAAGTSLGWPPARGFGRRVDKEALGSHVLCACVYMTCVFVSASVCVSHPVTS